MKIRKGKIVGLQGNWMSGIAELVVDEVIGKAVIRTGVYCDNAPTVRALENCFGDVIGPAHTINHHGGHVGKEIYFSTDPVGVLEAFTPVEDAPPEMVRIYEEAIP